MNTWHNGLIIYCLQFLALLSTLALLTAFACLYERRKARRAAQRQRHRDTLDLADALWCIDMEKVTQ